MRRSRGRAGDATASAAALKGRGAAEARALPIPRCGRGELPGGKRAGFCRPGPRGTALRAGGAVVAPSFRAETPGPGDPDFFTSSSLSRRPIATACRSRPPSFACREIREKSIRCRYCETRDLHRFVLFESERSTRRPSPPSAAEEAERESADPKIAPKASANKRQQGRCNCAPGGARRPRPPRAPLSLGLRPAQRREGDKPSRGSSGPSGHPFSFSQKKALSGPAPRASAAS
jgi:hypothetical protein